MSVVEAKIQTVEEIYARVWTAIAARRPVAAVYHGHRRLLCPHRLGTNERGALRVLCYQYGGDSQSGLEPTGSPSNWRCLVLEKLSKVELLEDSWRTASNHSRPASCLVNPHIDAEDYPEREQNGQ
jgi:hypothetical protein